MTDPASGPDTALRLSRALGPKYQVRQLLGRGGFAEVYEVWDQELERRLAVKVLRPDIAWTPGMLQRFRQEAKAVARLNHPNILAIHFVGEGEGLVFYAMPYIEGHSLAELLRREAPWPVERVVRLADALLEALEHAHQQGLLHRDIKPENIMIERPSGKPLLVDFGIAKRLDAGRGLTQTGFVVGTPQYMSPEQALGDAKLDARSDLYSLGAVLFQTLTGAPPFEGESSQEVVAKHLTEPPPAPHRVNPDVPEWLSAVVVRCLAKKPADRFPTAQAMREALGAGWAASQPVAVSRAQYRPSGPTVRIASAEAPAGSAVGTEGGAPASGSGGRALTGSPGKKWPRLWGAAGAVGLLGLVGGYLLWTRPVLVFENRLIEPVRLMAGGRERVVEPGAALRIPWSRRRTLVAEWRLLQPTSPEGAAMGVPVTGRLVWERPRGQRREAARARGAGTAVFAPLITNQTGRPIRITVNAGLQSALSCGCVVPPGAERVRIGYYPLYRNSTVRAEDAQGRSATFRDLGPEVDPASGAVGLRFGPADLVPESGRSR